MAGTVVVDVNLAVKWVIQEPLTGAARALLVQWEDEQVVRFVPALFLSELSSPLLKLRRQGAITLAEAQRAREDVLAAVTFVPDSAERTERAFRIADRLGLRVAYDSLYAALAEAEGCELWTADEQYVRAARVEMPWVHWLGEVNGM